MQLAQHPWEATQLGLRSSWSESLRVASDYVTATLQPMLMWWGSELLGVYNDAAAALLGTTTLAPRLGRPARDAWRSQWDVLAPVLLPAQLGQSGQTPDVLWTAESENGDRRFERYISISCTPVRAEAGLVAGVLGSIEDTTARVLADRRMRLLSQLASATRKSSPWQAIQSLLPTAAYDLPFVLIYEISPDETRACLRVSVGVPDGDRRAPLFVRLDSASLWPLQSVRNSGEACLMSAAQLGFDIPGGPWPERVEQLMLYPMCTRGRCEAVAVVGLSPRLPFDESYRMFTDLVVRECEFALIETGELASLHEARRRQRKLQEEAEAASRAKDEFLALLGHELRNPLAPIVTALHLMRMRDGGGNKEREVIERQVEHLRRLVDDLLDIARITRGKLKLDVRRISVEDVVERAVEIAAPLLEERRHPLHVLVPSHLQVRGDVIRLAQVVANLLTNAAKYSGEGAPIFIEAVEQEQELLLSVTDHGVGIPTQMLPHLFDPFVQVGRQERQSAGGLGLGLALVRSLTELHGGRVTVDSDGPGLGSRFVLHLPALRGQSAASRTDLPRVGEDLPGDDRRRVLVVDDNEDAAEMLAVVLRREGYTVEVAHDGPSAIDKAAWFHPQIGILDIGLPVMDGYVLARKLREQVDKIGGELTLVAVTGYGRPRDRLQALATGFDEHFVKPVDFEALRTCLAGLGRIPRGCDFAADRR